MLDGILPKKNALDYLLFHFGIMPLILNAGFFTEILLQREIAVFIHGLKTRHDSVGSHKEQILDF